MIASGTKPRLDLVENSVENRTLLSLDAGATDGYCL